MKPKAVVIGAGVGGIAAAIRAAAAGYDVKVYESAAGPGGKLSSFSIDGYRFDRGPSLFTMPQYVDELFELCGERASDHFDYVREDVVCRYFWDDRKQLTAFADPVAFSEEAARVFAVRPELVSEALRASELKYSASGRIFLEQPLHKLRTWLSGDVLRALPKLSRMDLGATMHEVNERLLEQPQLVQLFDRFATYNGSNPYRAPGILTVIPTFEHLLGTFLPVGGMFDITQSLVALAERQGVEFAYGARVTRVESRAGKVVSVLCGGERVPCDLLISNVDVHYFYQNLMPRARKPVRTLRQERSTSALIFYWGVRKRFPELELHNIFFAQDYRAEFAALQAGEIADDFTVYVNVGSKRVSADAPAGCENWFVMVNAPYDRAQDWAETTARVRRQTIAKLSAQLDVDLAKFIDVEHSWTPPGIDSDTGSHLGALYGTSSNSKWAAFLRHRNSSKEFTNLYFVGGSVHPGGGVPLALLSAKIAAGLMPNPATAC